jgi:hypothetical protein
MSLTKAKISTIIVSRCGAKMTAAGMNSSNLDDPIGWALRRVGITPADITSITDSDLTAVPVDDYDKLLDLAELRTLENVSGNLTLTDITAGPQRQALNQIVDQVEKAISRLIEKIQRNYGVGAAVLETGSISLGFQETIDGTELMGD